MTREGRSTGSGSWIILLFAVDLLTRLLAIDIPLGVCRTGRRVRLISPAGSLDPFELVGPGELDGARLDILILRPGQ